ncbi:MAG: porin, partial [Burkholderiaceae bacterium]|nr:porin [Burkholderiaceae bacterium]
MKKTLIAMAAVAVAGVASAQNATITGNFSFGQSGDTTNTGVSTRGYGTMTSNVTFAASEDLGGGMTMKASGGIDGFGEDGTVTGLGTDMSLSGGFGTIAFSSQESGDYLPVDGLTSQGAGTLADRITYTAPAMGPVTLSIT